MKISTQKNLERMHGTEVPVEAKALWAGFNSGPISGLKGQKRGTARLKSWGVAPANLLFFFAIRRPTASLAGASNCSKSQKTAPVRVLRDAPTPKNTVFRGFLENYAAYTSQALNASSYALTRPNPNSREATHLGAIICLKPHYVGRLYA